MEHWYGSAMAHDWEPGFWATVMPDLFLHLLAEEYRVHLRLERDADGWTVWSWDPVRDEDDAIGWAATMTDAIEDARRTLEREMGE